MNGRRFFLSILLGFLAIGMVGAFGQSSSDELKARMAKRLKAVDALRAAGKVGENNLGFLAARTRLNAEEETLLKAENADRKEVYTLIARKTGESIALVGQKRAEVLRKLSKPGLWLQDTRDKWYRKQ